MKRILLSIFVVLSGQTILAMEPEKSVKSDFDLTFAIRNQNFQNAIDLINQGADVNSPEIDKPIDAIFFINDRMNDKKNESRIRIVERLIEKGLKITPQLLLDCMNQWDIPLFGVFLNAGANIYEAGEFLDIAQDKCIPYLPLVYHATLPDRLQRLMYPETHLRFVEMITEKALCMTTGEILCVKGWLLLDQRLRLEKRGLITDLKRPIAQAMINGLVYDAHGRLVRAGAREALDRLPDTEENKQMRNYLFFQLKHVRKYVCTRVFGAVQNVLK